MNSIKIGGEDRSVVIGWGTLKEFGKETGRTFGQVFSVTDLSFDDIETLIYVSLKHGGNECTKDDVSEWLEKDISVVPAFMEVFQEELSAALDEKN